MKLSAVVLALAMLSGASALTGVRQFMEQDAQMIGKSPQWSQRARATASDEVKLQFWLKHNSTEIAAFEEELLELATPGSPSYAQWMSRDEVVSALSPAPHAVDAVATFALDHGASDVHVNKMRSIVSVTVPATVAEEMLQTELYHYQNKEYKGVSIIRAAAAYSLPVEIAEHVSIVGDIIRFPRLRQKLQIEEAKPQPVEDATSEWSACGAAYSSYTNPSVLASAYGFEFPFTKATAGNSIAVAEFQGQYYDTDDLEAFSSQCGLDQTVTVSTNVGGNNEARCQVGLEPCVESLLDIEYAGAIAGAIPLSVYYSGTFSLLDWAETLLDQDDAELVHSVSYGNDEAQQTSADYMESVNTQFMKAGAQGLTIMFAAGDQGVWGREGVGKTYHPDFPAGSPYVTAVGGTDFSTKSTIGEETAWASGGSGFSDEFSQPSWQADQVAAYFANPDADLPSSSFYNAEGRGYPDISALAGQVNPYFISFKGGKFSAVAGTSAACPVAAGIIAQVNDARLAAGKTSMGWLQPFLYSADASSYNDVTSGTTNGGYTGGFTATEGWDPATGFGSINFSAFKEAALSY